MADQMTITTAARGDRTTARRVVSSMAWLLDHWVLVFLAFFGIFLILPFVAPVFMHAGWDGTAQLIYAIYSTQCHQMAQRSFFLFGPQPMYNIAQLPVSMTGNGATDMLALRAFVGNADVGWKVAWSDRMVYMYGSMWLTALVFAFLRHRRNIRPVKWYVIILLLLPMAMDGGTHWLSDLMGGMGGGFRYDNTWLARLTGNALPTWFYAGDALGSFNSWMRLISGILFGIAILWLAFPTLDRSIRESAAQLHTKLSRPAPVDPQFSTDGVREAGQE